MSLPIIRPGAGTATYVVNIDFEPHLLKVEVDASIDSVLGRAHVVQHAEYSRRIPVLHQLHHHLVVEELYRRPLDTLRHVLFLKQEEKVRGLCKTALH